MYLLLGIAAVVSSLARLMRCFSRRPASRLPLPLRMSILRILLSRASLSPSFHFALPPSKCSFSSTNPSALPFASSPPFRCKGFGFHVPYCASHSTAAAAASAEDSSEDTVEELLTRRGDRIERLMKMERRSAPEGGCCGHWFPYCDIFRSGNTMLGSREVIAALDPHIMEARKERIWRAVENRSYFLCLVVEGLTNFRNVS